MHEPSGSEAEPFWRDLAVDLRVDDGKDKLAAEFGRRGGLKGGKARAEKLSPDERTGIARRAAAARWGIKPAGVEVPRDPSVTIASATASLRAATLGEKFGTLLADPPWRFVNRTGKVAPEHKRLARYGTMTIAEISALPVREIAADRSHLYLWTPNALIADALRVMEAWGFTYKAMLVWHKVRKDGGSDGRGVGFYFRNVTETILFGTRGNLRTFAPGRRQVNLLATRKREHSRKPDELYSIVEACSPGPFMELFARYPQPGWRVWGDESGPDVTPKGHQHKGYGA